MPTTSLWVTTRLTSQPNHSSTGHWLPDVQKESVPEGCIPVRFSEMEFIPSNNPDNIMTLAENTYVRRARFSLLQVLFLTGGPANVINMAVFYKQSLRDRVNLLLFSLSLADELFLVASMSVYGEEFFLQVSGETKPGFMLAFMVNNHLIGFLRLCFVSFVLSAIIACERCYCVLRPLNYHSVVSTRTMACVIIAVFTVILSVGFVVVFRYNFVCFYYVDIGIAKDVLTHSEFYMTHKTLIDYLDSIFFGAGLPVGMAIVVVSATGVTISRLRQAVLWRYQQSSVFSPREVALTKMLIGTSVLLIICVSPGCLFRIACLFLPELNSGRRHQNLYLAFLWITDMFLYVNSTFNIAIYYVMGTRYRETFWTLFRRQIEQTKREK